jgi:DNA mismatch repair protein MutL
VKDKSSTIFKALAGGLETRIADVLKEVAKNLSAVSASNGYARLHGFVGKPGFVRKDRRYQFVFVNRRLVKNELVARAVSDSLPILPSHHPLFVLFLEIDPSMVDVNIHPNKLEVKFSNPDLVYALVGSAVVPIASKKAEISEKVELSQRKGNVYDVGKGKQETLAVGSKESGVRKEQSGVRSPESGILPKLQTPNPRPETDYRVIGQLNLTYILCESRGSLVLLDQHAVQEKIFFEKLFLDNKNSQIKKQEKKQELISPVVIDFGIEFGAVKAHLGLLMKKGVDIEEFGENSMVVRAVPAAFVDYYGEVNADSLNDLVLNIRLWEKDFAGAEYYKYATKACRGAIKAGRELTHLEMERLVSELQRCKNPNTCPHGRPIAVKISIGEFEKKFKRTV